MLQSLLPKEVKLNIIVDEIRLRTNLTTNKTKKLTEKVIFFSKYQVVLLIQIQKF